MGLFDLFKKKTMNKPQLSETKPPPIPVRIGNAVADKIELDVTTAEMLRQQFIAFDVETTGLSPAIDRVVEIGAVLFANGEPVDSFSTLVNPHMNISASATAVSHITNNMLSSAPLEQDVYPRLIEFLGEALCGNVIMCAHNAKFDFDFLCRTLSRLGYDAHIRYTDTLSLSRKYIKGLNNYKQCTLEGHLGLINSASHRASSDAEVCGKILCSIINYADEALASERKQIEQATPLAEELAVCAFIQSVIVKNGGDTRWLRYRKNSSNYIDVTCLYTFIKFKFAKKGRYIIINRNFKVNVDLPIAPCTESEGGADNIRVYFSSPFDLEPFSQFVYNAYVKCYKSLQEYISVSNYARREAENSIRLMKALSNSEIDLLLKEAECQEYAPLASIANFEPIITLDAVTINAKNNRVSLSQIKNLNNWDNGFKTGFPYWEQGENARKDGRIEEAISFFDKARYNGYDTPALYNSYAMAYRQIKDYDNEIVIIEEGISRMPDQASILESRRNKAIKLLYTQQETIRKTEAKAHVNAEKMVKKEAATVEPKQVRGRAIVQMADDGAVIKEYESISAAVQEIGVSSKSIRDAANGVQKHAGGFRWMYKDSRVTSYV